MGLSLIAAANWKTKRPEEYVINGGYVAYGNYFLVNTNRISELRTLNSGYTQFLFTQAPDDRRCSPDVVESTNSVAVITSYADLAENSKFGTIPIFPAWDTTEATVDTMINWSDICMIYQTPSDWATVAHMVYYKESWKRKTCLIDLSLLEVLALEYVGS